MDTSHCAKRTRPTITLSPATQADVPAMARLFLLAFHNDEQRPALTPSRFGLSVTKVLSRDSILEERRLRRGLVGTDVYMKASVQVPDNMGTEIQTVVGWAKWGAPAGVRHRSIWEWIWSDVLYPLHQLLFRPAIATGVPDAARQLFSSQFEDTFGPGGLAEGRKIWYLHLLCVDPAWQGHGVGGTLLKWGMEKAKEMDAVVYLESSPGALPFYVANGFRVASDRPGKVNGIHVRLPGMIWEPRSVGRVKN